MISHDGKHASHIKPNGISEPQPQFRHAAELAQELIRHLGPKGAERTCRENHWSGVLDAVKAISQRDD